MRPRAGDLWLLPQGPISTPPAPRLGDETDFYGRGFAGFSAMVRSPPAFAPGKIRAECRTDGHCTHRASKGPP